MSSKRIQRRAGARLLLVALAGLLLAAAAGCSRAPDPVAPPPEPGDGAAPGATAPAATEPAAAEPIPAPAEPGTGPVPSRDAIAGQAADVLTRAGWQPSGPAQVRRVTVPAEIGPQTSQLWQERLAVTACCADPGFMAAAGQVVWQAEVPVAAAPVLPPYNRPPRLTGMVLITDHGQELAAWVEVAVPPEADSPPGVRPLSLGGFSPWDDRVALDIDVRAEPGGGLRVGPWQSWSRDAQGFWFPDGRRLLIWASRNGWYQFWTLDPATRDLRPFWRWDERDANAMPVAWLADGRLAVLAASFDLMSLWAVDPAGGAVAPFGGVAQPLGRAEDAIYKSHFVDPSGPRLIVHASGRLLAFDLAGGGVQEVYAGLPSWDGLYGVRPSPDGQWVALPALDDAALRLVHPGSGRQATLLGAGLEFDVWSLAWAPDSRRLAYKPTGDRREQAVEAGDFYHMLTPEAAVVDLEGREVARRSVPGALISEMAWQDGAHLVLAVVPEGTTYTDLPEPAAYWVAPLDGGPLAPFDGDFRALAEARWQRPFPMHEGTGQGWTLDAEWAQESGQAPQTWLILRP